jgi:putative ABC transport system permease protein
MKTLPLIVKNLFRNRRRSILTLLGVAIAIFVYAALQAAVDGILFPVRQAAQESVLTVREKGRATVLASRLPSSLEPTLGALPGVEVATGVFTDLTVVGQQRVHIFVHGIDPEPYRQLKRLRVPDDAWQRFNGERRAALVGSLLAQQMGWKEGQVVELKEFATSFVIAGLLPIQGSDLDRHMLLQRPYLQATRGTEGRVTSFLIRPRADAREADVARAIDERFALAQTPTETASEAAFAQGIVEQFLGFVGYLRVMGFITVLVTFFGAANAVSMNVRERLKEIGVLRALGFTPRDIVWLVAGESSALSLMGGLLGLGLAAASLGGRAALLAGLHLEPKALLVGVGASFSIGLIGGLLPALSAVRLSVVETLRRVD